MSTPDAGRKDLVDVAGAAAHLGVSTTFIRRLVLEKRVRYYKVGKFVRFRRGT
ncbi:MAG TPA: helix-turn-helix domain-containing protein [Acidimicrobiales bacterium]|jgi:excisionase family DNA binding protein